MGTWENYLGILNYALNTLKYLAVEISYKTSTQCRFPKGHNMGIESKQHGI